MPFIPIQIKIPTVKELLVNQLEDQILLGNLKIGEKLPSEREMSIQFSTSKTAVHNAICELERKGFVEVRARKGIYIADFLRTGTIDAFYSLLRFNGGKLDMPMVKSIIDLRKHIELPAIELAVSKLNGTRCNELEEILARGKSAYEQSDSHSLSVCLFEFSREICIQSGNIITPMLFNAFKPLTIPFWEESLLKNGITYGMQVLENYYTAVTNGDAVGAQNIIKADLSNFLS